MNLFRVLVLLSIVPLILTVEVLPNRLRQFIDRAFQTNIKTVHLVGLENLPSFGEFSALPHPKVILHQNESIAAVDATCLVVLYLELSTGEKLYNSLSTVLNIVGRHSTNAKFVVLIDDVFLQYNWQRAILNIGIMFAFHGIPYWSVTGHHEAFNMHYTTKLAAGILFHTIPCDYDHAFSTHRVLPLEGVKLTALFLESFPYTYLTRENYLLGLDVFIFLPILEHLKSDTLYNPLKMDGDSSKIMLDLVSKLQNAEVDLLLSRRTIGDGDFSSIHIPESIFLCIVVPRSFRVDLVSALMRPFDNSVWIALGIAFVASQLKKILLKSNNQIGKALAVLERLNNWQTFSTIAIEWISFILIECYFAQVTSFFIDLRFQPDPQTLEEFFDTNIPIRLPEEQNALLDHIDPSVAEAIRRRAVTEEACAEFSVDCAHLDRHLRATYIINNYQTIDPSAGAKRSFILKETVFSYSCAYVFARGSPLKDLFAVYLQRLFEAGIVQWHMKGANSYIRSPQFQYEESLQFEHLTSIWLFIVIGWTIAIIVFLVELVFDRLKTFLFPILGQI